MRMFAPSSTTMPATRHTGLLVALILAVAGYQINATMIAPAIPDVVAGLHTTSGLVGLSQTLFFLMAALGQMTIGRLSDYLGRRRMLLATMAVLLLGEAVSLIAPNIWVFIVGRMLQGVSSAAFTLAYLILHERLSRQRFGRALGIVTAVNGGIAGVDVLIAGAVTDAFGFRSIFVITFVVTVAALVAVVVAVPKMPVTGGRGMDWKGAGLLGLGLTGVLIALSQGASWGWTSPTTLVVLIVALLALALFPTVERRSPDPFIDTAVLASRRVWPLLLTTMFILAGVFGTLNFTIPLLTQNPDAGYGMSALTSALLFLTPASALGVAAAPIAGHFGPRIGWRRSVLIGTIGTTIAFVPLAVVPQSQWVVIAGLAMIGITFTGYSLTALHGLAVELAPADKPGSLPSINGACFGVGASLGIAVVAGVVTALTAGSPLTFAALHAALWTSAGFVVLGLLASLLIKTRTPAGNSDTPQHDQNTQVSSGVR